MQGQIGFEFIISSVVFLITIVYASTTIFNMLPAYHDQAILEHAEANAYALSQYLLFDNLSSGNYVLDSVKVNSFCTNYNDLLNEFGYSEIIISITKLDGTPVMECVPEALSAVREEFFVNRFAIFDNDIVIMKVAAI